MTDQEIAKALLQIVDGTQFPGALRKQIVEIGEWLSKLETGALVTAPKN